MNSNKGKMMMGDDLALSYGDQSNCSKKGKMIMGKTGKMNATNKLTSYMMASKK